MSLKGIGKNYPVDPANNGFSKETSGKKEEKLDTSKLAANNLTNQTFINKKNGSMGKRSFEDLTDNPPLRKKIPGPNRYLSSMRMGG